MRKAIKLAALVLAVITLIACMPVISAAGTVAYGAATVNASSLNVRTGGSTSAEKIGCLPNGTQVIVLSKGNGVWYQINYQGLVGYVHSDYLKNVTTSADFSTTTGAATSGTATVNASALNIRASGSTSATKVDCAPRGAVLTLLDTGDGVWYHISYKGKEGYVHSDYLTNVTMGASATVTALSGYVNDSSVRMRSGASTSTSVLATLSRNTAVTVLGIESGWYKISVNGTVGYMRSDYINVTGTTGSSGGSSSGGSVSVGSSSGGSSNTGSSGGNGTVPEPPVTTTPAPTPAPRAVLPSYSDATVSDAEYSEMGQKIANMAMKYKGYRYVYGAESPSDGFDCSGLAYYVYHHYGYMIQRTTFRQIKYDGVSVSKSDLKVGDLIFFSTDKVSATHVGIYIGGGKFVHASNSTVGVIVSNLSSSYYTKNFFGARRIV